MCSEKPTVAFALLALLATADSAWGCDSRTCACQAAEALSHTRQGAWWIATTANFQVCSLQSPEQAELDARYCETVRASLIEALGLSRTEGSWRPKCQVIFHATTRGYAAAVGAPFAATYGSSLVKPTRGPIRSRRIDVRANVANYLSEALPHELCHVLLADCFRDQAPPLWYDEGIALLADTVEKQRLHERDRVDGVQRGLSYTLSELISTTAYPPSERMGVFYGQCAALTRYLRNLGTSEQLYRFVLKSQEVGVNQAAIECYGFVDGRELEKNWLASLNKRGALHSVQVLPVAIARNAAPSDAGVP